MPLLIFAEFGDLVWCLERKQILQILISTCVNGSYSVVEVP